jgi:serine/threonine-protein kinase
VVHRDLKPHNVIVDEEGRARVTDFGIARAGASDMTLTGSIMGTAQYLSPEQAQGQAVSASSDLYSVGVILYELLTGVVPFEGETAVAIAFKQVSAEPLPPSALNPALPASLDAIVLRALAKDPAQRYADADEFIAALQQARLALPLSAPGPASPPPDGFAPGTGPLLMPAAGPFVDEPSSSNGNHRRLWLWSGVAALVVAAVVLAVVLSSGSGKVKVPDVVGLTEAAAVVRLKAAGLAPVAASRASTTTANGVVFVQTPAFGQVVKDGARVNLVVSSGPPTTPLANVEGLSAARAVSKLRAAGFKPVTKPKASTSIGEGLVIATEPPAGTSLPVGTTVTVLVSSGPSPVRVPDTVGETRAAAEAALDTAELGVGTVTQQVSATQTPETVLSQSPAAASMLRVGGKVNLVVAKAPKDVSVPAVVGQNETEAAAALGRAGFSPKAVTEPTTESSQVGVVLKQSPAAGASAPKGGTVTITVGVLSGATTPTTPTTTTPTTPTTTGATVPPAAAPAG